MFRNYIKSFVGAQSFRGHVDCVVARISKNINLRGRCLEFKAKKQSSELSRSWVRRFFGLFLVHVEILRVIA